MQKVRFFNLFKHVASPLDVRHILFITLSNIGDAILTTPTLEALNKQFPNAKIDIVCDQRSAIVFQYCPYLGQLLIKNKQSGWSGLWHLVRQLRKKKYDIAVDLRTDGLLHFVKAKVKAFKLSNRGTMNMHSAEKHYAVLNNICAAPIPSTNIWVSDKEAAFANHALKMMQQKRILAVGIGANFKGKIWPASSFASLANLLKSFFDIVLVFGDKNDACLALAFESTCELPVINYCGKLNLLETAALMQKVHFFIGNDSGLGHIASALGIQTFTVFGVGQPERYLPWSKQAKWYQDPKLEITNVDASMIAKMIAPTLQTPQ